MRITRNSKIALAVLIAVILALLFVPQTGEAAVQPAPVATKTKGLTVMPGAESGGLATEFKRLVAVDRQKQAAKRRLKHTWEWPGNPWGSNRPFFPRECVDDALTDDPANCMPLTSQRYQGTAAVNFQGSSVPAYGQTIYGNSPVGTSGALSSSFFHMSVGTEAVQNVPGSAWGFDIYAHCRAQMGGGSISLRPIAFNETYSQRYSNTYIRPMIGLAATIVNGSYGPPWRSVCVYSMLLQGTDQGFQVSTGLLTYWGQYNFGADGL